MRNTFRTLAVAAGLITLTVALVVVLLSVVLLPDANWVVRVVLMAFCGLAIARPADALLITTALIGFGIILSHLAGIPPLRTSDVLVAACLFGCCVRVWPRDSLLRSGLQRTISIPIVLFALTAIASTIVWLRVYQVQAGSASTYVESFFLFVARQYFVTPGEFGVVVSTVTILQGLALFVVVVAWSRVDGTFFARGLRMLTIGGAGLAMMSVVRLVEILNRNPHVVEELRRSYAGLRISPQIPDYIAAGSYFSLCWLSGLGLALASPRGWRVWGIVCVPLAAGLYLTGSRSVIAAALAGLAVLVLTIARARISVDRRVLLVGGAAVIVMIASFPFIIGHDVLGATARQSLQVRGELLRAGVHVVATRPFFGVGVDRFHLVAGVVKSPLLESLWQTRRNPHNDLLRFAGELGLVGLALFLAILIPEVRRIWRSLRSTRDASLAGLAGGLVAFFVTSMVSNPLMLREVSYVFWIALGLAVGHSASAEPQLAADEISKSTSAPGWFLRFRLPLALVMAALLCASIPFRVKQEITTLDPTRVSYGLSDWDSEPDGTRFRWSEQQATLFVSARARRVEIPVRGTLPLPAPQHVKVRLDGRVINDIVVGPDWQWLAIVLLGGDLSKPRRIDLDVSPTWTRHDLTGGDNRVVGVKVGVLNVIR